MSRSRHPRGNARLYSAHLRKNKEWGVDTQPWKPYERRFTDERETRCVRKRVSV